MSEETKGKVKFVCKILSLLPSIAFLLGEILPNQRSETLDNIVGCLMIGMILVGWIATFVTGPLKVLKKMFKPVGAVWAWGTAIMFPWGILIGLFGAVFVLWFMLFAFAFIPFVYTLGN